VHLGSVVILFFLSMANPTQQQSGDPNFLSFATSSSRYKAIVPSGTPPVLPAKPNATRAW
jgi:hypothetical protein